MYIGRGGFPDDKTFSDGEVGVLLNELHNPINVGHIGKSEAGFNIIRFCLLEKLVQIEDNETHHSIPVPVKVKAEA